MWVVFTIEGFAMIQIASKTTKKTQAKTQKNSFETRIADKVFAIHRAQIYYAKSRTLKIVYANEAKCTYASKIV